MATELGAKIDIFLDMALDRFVFYLSNGFFSLEPAWLTKAAGPKLHHWGQS